MATSNNNQAQVLELKIAEREGLLARVGDAMTPSGARMRSLLERDLMEMRGVLLASSAGNTDLDDPPTSRK